MNSWLVISMDSKHLYIQYQPNYEISNGGKRVRPVKFDNTWKKLIVSVYSDPLFWFFRLEQQNSNSKSLDTYGFGYVFNISILNSVTVCLYSSTEFWLSDRYGRRFDPQPYLFEPDVQSYYVETTKIYFVTIIKDLIPSLNWWFVYINGIDVIQTKTTFKFEIFLLEAGRLI